MVVLCFFIPLVFSAASAGEEPAAAAQAAAPSAVSIIAPSTADTSVQSPLKPGTLIVWPVSIEPGGGKIVLYEPQVRSWPKYTQMTGVAAVAVTLPGASAPAYGALSFASLANADVPSGMVSLVNPKLVATNWPNASPADAAGLDAFVKANLHLEGKPLLPLAMVLSSLPRSDRPNPAPIRANPPVIYVSQTPAVLIVFDGKPAFAPIPGTALTYAVNTNWEIVHDPGTALYYIHAKTGWYSSPGPNGPFVPTLAPASFGSIPATGRFASIHSSVVAPKPSGALVPRVIVSMVPTALVDIAGQPQFASIPATQLRYVSNTTSDVFFSRDTTVWYVLLAGRWFTAANLNGPWSFASTHLPADFKKIPPDSPKGKVLVSVPGTTQAFYAASAAQVPHVAAVDPASTKLTVRYSGAPQFVPIAGTPLKYAMNTTDDVISVDAKNYLACNGGVWFAATSPTGPWNLATYVPAVVYTIPSSSPLYHVTFVHVYDANGVALNAPLPTPAPKPQDTYQKFPPSQFSNGDAANYYYQNSAGYFGGYAPGWGGYASGTGYYNPGYIGVSTYITNPPTYGNYSDTTFARQQAQSSSNPTRSAQLAMPAHGPRSVPGPNANVYAADDGVYRSIQDGWQKNAGGDSWTTATTTPPSLIRDHTARLDGYAGIVRGSGGN